MNSGNEAGTPGNNSISRRPWPVLAGVLGAGIVSCAFFGCSTPPAGKPPSGANGGLGNPAQATAPEQATVAANAARAQVAAAQGSLLPAFTLGRRAGTEDDLADGSVLSEGLQFSRDGRVMAVTRAIVEPVRPQEQPVEIWDMPAGKQAPRRRMGVARGSGQDAVNWVRNSALSPDGKTLAVLHIDGDVRLWDTKTGRKTATVNLELEAPGQGGSGAVAFASNRLLYLCGEGKKVLSYDLQSRRLQATKINRQWYPMAFSSDGRLVCIAAKEAAKVYAVATGKLVAKLEPPIDGTPVFSPDGRLLAGSYRGMIKVWHVLSGYAVTSFPEIKAGEAVAFSPNALLLASTAASKNIVLWNVVNGAKLKTLSHNGVTALGFARDGLLVSGSTDTTLKVWNLPSRPSTL